MEASKINSSLSFADFCKQAKNTKIVTNYRELFADLDTPLAIYAKLRKYSDDAFLFESVLGGEQIGRYSLIGYKILDKIVSSLEDDSDCYKNLEEMISAMPQQEDVLPFFHKGFVGYFSFESIARIEPKLKTKKTMTEPESYLLLVGSLVIFDHVQQKLYLIDNSKLDETKLQNESYLEAIYQDSNKALDEMSNIINEAIELARLDFDLSSFEAKQDDGFESNTGKKEFKSMVETAKKNIYEGNIFQAVISHKFTSQIKVDALTVYRILRTINPSPYLFIFNFKDSGALKSLVGSSPEMLVKTSVNFDGNGDKEFQAEIRPIAGTYKRAKTQAEDDKLAEALVNDVKERAEHVMLIDLARNDLGRVCQPGSISLPKQMFIEKYSHVLHIVSSVTGKIKKAFKEKSGLELLRACFPAGTLSGSPKVEAVKIISELEKEARGPYGGSIGYFALDGSIDTAILIRTLLIEESQVTVQAGAGIVADSDPDSEWQETFNKAAALKLVANIAAQS